MTHTTHLYIEDPIESVSHMSAPIPDAARSLLTALAPTPAPEAAAPAPAAPQTDEAAWDAWQRSMFGGLATTAPVAAPQQQQPDPSTAAFDDFERSTFPDLNR